MSKNLINFLSNLKIALNEEQFSYVYFSSATGMIEKISNKFDEETDLKILKVKYNLVKDLINGKRRIEDYGVLYNSKAKDFEILELEKNINIRNINNSLLKINKSSNAEKEKVDVLVQQDNKNQCWNFFINSKINFLKNVNDFMFFSITEKNDPNILYRTISFNVADSQNNCISIPYIYETEKDIEKISVFTHKVLDTYLHEVINE